VHFLSGKVPVLKCGAYVVAEMDGIVQLVRAITILEKTPFEGIKTFFFFYAG